jgi:hypothetical protein
VCVFLGGVPLYTTRVHPNRAKQQAILQRVDKAYRSCDSASTKFRDLVLSQTQSQSLEHKAAVAQLLDCDQQCVNLSAIHEALFDPKDTRPSSRVKEYLTSQDLFHLGMRTKDMSAYDAGRKRMAELQMEQHKTLYTKFKHAELIEDQCLTPGARKIARGGTFITQSGLQNKHQHLDAVGEQMFGRAKAAGGHSTSSFENQFIVQGPTPESEKIENKTGVFTAATNQPRSPKQREHNIQMLQNWLEKSKVLLQTRNAPASFQYKDMTGAKLLSSAPTLGKQGRKHLIKYWKLLRDNVEEGRFMRKVRYTTVPASELANESASKTRARSKSVKPSKAKPKASGRSSNKRRRLSLDLT